MKEKQPRKLNSKEIKQIAVPFVDNSPEAIERTKKALADFAAAVREDKTRPLTQEEWESKEELESRRRFRRRFNRLSLEPLD